MQSSMSALVEHLVCEVDTHDAIFLQEWNNSFLQLLLRLEEELQPP